jgi:hypothetical protein
VSRHIIIDGNNLLHAVHAHARQSFAGREALTRMIQQWAVKQSPRPPRVTLVYDGPPPSAGLERQMQASVAVLFSGILSADDVIIEMIHKDRNPANLEIVSCDGAIIHEARYQKCHTTDSGAFVRRIESVNAPKSAKHPNSARSPSRDAAPDDKPRPPLLSTDDWLTEFNADDIEIPDQDPLFSEEDFNFTDDDFSFPEDE